MIMFQQSSSLSRALSPKTIDEFSAHTQTHLQNNKLSRRDSLRYALAMEEILNNSMASNGEGAAVSLRFSRRFFQPFILLSISGEAENVYGRRAVENGVLNGSILKSLGINPEYSFKGGENRYSFRVARKRLNPFLSILITFLAALTVSSIGYLFPEEVRSGIVSGFLSPLHNTFLNVLSCVAGPMIFLSVAWGIYGIGDAATLKRIGKRVLFGFIGTVFLTVLIATPVCALLLRVKPTSSESGGSSLSSIFSMLLAIFPSNIFSPFVDGNMLQVIFLAVVIGIAMLFLGEKTSAVARAVEQINLITQLLIEFISRLVPYFVFIVLVSMAWSNMADVFLDMVELVPVFLLLVVSKFVITLIWTALRLRVNPLLLLRKGFPALLVALSTASSAAAFGYNSAICREEYGIDDSLTSFGLPLGIVAFKGATAIFHLCIALFFAKLYQIDVSASWILLLVFTVCILSLATPPIPGGSLAAYTVLFAQLGIPSEALALVLTIDGLSDFIDTGLDQFLMPLTLLVQASKLGMVNREKLTRKKPKA